MQGHYRSSPNSTKSDNYSTKGNYNPYTGKPGTKTDNSSNYNYPSTNSASSNSENLNDNYKDWSSYTVDEFYVKIELPSGTLDSRGNRISYIYKKTDSPKTGKYEISISDSDGELFEIKGAELFVMFRSMHGYAGYSEEGILDIESYSSVFYKKP